jgi:ribonucleoside-diphosphate reductase alpha chain
MLSQNVENLLQQRYYKPGENWEKLVNRVVEHVCAGELYDYKLLAKKLIYNRIFIPNSPCLVNSATKSNGLFACFVVGPTEDTLESGFNTLRDIAFIAKRGGGCGFTGSIMRPANSPVAGSAHGYSYGPNRFAELVSYAMDMMTQSGFRKMALMYTLDCEHPDIEDFINLKQTLNESSLYNFNQSVMMSDEWIRRALIGNTNETRLFAKIVEHAWNNGEPGCLFSDTMNRDTPYKYSNQKIYATNPCSEQALPPYGSCNLGSINIANDVFFNKDGSFDYDEFDKVVRFSTQFLDNVGVVNEFPTNDFAQWYESNRPVGVGLMGVADAMLKLRIKYGSEASLEFLNDVGKVLLESSYAESEKLGVERGIPLAALLAGNETGSYRRNITTVSIAPTGSIAFIAECSHGIEPIFSPSYKRVDERGKEYLFTHALKDEDYFVSAIGSKTPTWKEQIDIVKVIQQNCDSGVSKTINLANSATKQDVQDAFIYAWEGNCKGITVYRDGSRQFQILTEVKEEDSLEQSCKNGVCTI